MAKTGIQTEQPKYSAKGWRPSKEGKSGQIAFVEEPVDNIINRKGGVKKQLYSEKEVQSTSKMVKNTTSKTPATSSLISVSDTASVAAVTAQEVFKTSETTSKLHQSLAKRHSVQDKQPSCEFDRLKHSEKFESQSRKLHAVYRQRKEQLGLTSSSLDGASNRLQRESSAKCTSAASSSKGAVVSTKETAVSARGVSSATALSTRGIPYSVVESKDTSEFSDLVDRFFKKFPSFISVAEFIVAWKQTYYKQIKKEVKALSLKQREQSASLDSKNAVIQEEGEALLKSISLRIRDITEFIVRIETVCKEKDFNKTTVNLEVSHIFCQLKTLCGDLYRYMHMVNPTADTDSIHQAKLYYEKSVCDFPYDGHSFIQMVLLYGDKLLFPLQHTYFYFRSLICVFSSHTHNFEDLSLFLEKQSIRNVAEKPELPTEKNDTIVYFQLRYIRLIQLIYCKISTEQFPLVMDSTLSAFNLLLRCITASEETLLVQIMFSAICLLIETSNILHPLKVAANSLFTGSEDIRKRSTAIHEKLLVFHYNGLNLSEELINSEERARMSLEVCWKFMGALANAAELHSPLLGAIITPLFWLRKNTVLFASDYVEAMKCRKSLAKLVVRCFPDKTYLSYPENLLCLTLPEDIYLRGFVPFPMAFPPEVAPSFEEMAHSERLTSAGMQEVGLCENASESDGEEVLLVGPVINLTASHVHGEASQELAVNMETGIRSNSEFSHGESLVSYFEKLAIPVEGSSIGDRRVLDRPTAASKLEGKQEEKTVVSSSPLGVPSTLKQHSSIKEADEAISSNPYLEQLDARGSPASPFGKEYSAYLIPYPRVVCKDAASPEDYSIIRGMRLYSLCSDIPELKEQFEQQSLSGTDQSWSKALLREASLSNSLNVTSQPTAKLLETMHHGIQESGKQKRVVSKASKKLIKVSPSEEMIHVQGAAEEAKISSQSKNQSEKEHVGFNASNGTRKSNSKFNEQYFRYKSKPFVPARKPFPRYARLNKPYAQTKRLYRKSPPPSDISPEGDGSTAQYFSVNEPKADELVVIDGSNVALRHGGFDTKRFSCKGIQLAVNYYKELKCKVLVFLPEYLVSYKEVGKHKSAKKSNIDVSEARIPDNVPLLHDLNREGLLAVTPAQDYDDSYAIKYAHKHNGFIVTNDLYRDHFSKFPNDAGRRWLKSHLISFTFVADEFLPNPDFLRE